MPNIINLVLRDKQFASLELILFAVVTNKSENVPDDHKRVINWADNQFLKK